VVLGLSLKKQHYMPTILLLRHAKSSWKNKFLTDEQRPLNKRGHRIAPRMAAYFRQHVPPPTEVWCSPSVRTRATYDYCRQAGWLTEVNCTCDERLYEASAAVLKRLFDASPLATRDCLLVIGHNPGFTDVINDLTTLHPPLDNVPTSGLAWLQCSCWPPRTGTVQLKRLIIPKEVVPN
jgi:phosphohistidine phosphatase